MERMEFIVQFDAIKPASVLS